MFEIGKTYSFNTLAPSHLGANVKNAKLMAVLDYDTALVYDNVELKYKTIYPLLPANSPAKASDTIYYRFLSESGEKIIIAEAWVQASTVEIIEHINFTVHFTQASIQDMGRVRDALTALGYSNFVLEQV